MQKLNRSRFQGMLRHAASARVRGWLPLARSFLVILFLSLWLVTRLPAQTVVKNDSRAALGYTFFAPTTSTTSYLISNDARVVHQWPGNGRAGWVVHLLPNGRILRTGTVTSSVFGNAAGSGGRIDELTGDGSLTWSYTLSTDKHLRHHDIAPLPNGNVLVIAWEVYRAEEVIAVGRDPNRISSGAFWAEAIFEVRPNRPTGGEVVWEWRVWDHLVQDRDPTKKNYGDVAAHPELMDINFGLQTPDWLHFNSIAYSPKLDQIMVGSRVLSEIWVIDHSTSTQEAAGHSGGRSGKGGDVLYRWGNPQTYRSGGPGDQRLVNQHGAHWIEPGLPGEGHILVFNNGDAVRNFSTVDEIVPPVDEKGAYARAAGAAFGPDKAVWSYGEEAQPRFQSRTFGGVQRLPNGNTLICNSNAFRIIEVTPEGEVVWEVDIGEAAAAGAGGGGGGAFRATRFPVNYDGLRGTDLFRAAPALVNAASMAGGPSAPAALATALGEGLAASSAAAGAGPLPGTLAGTSVEVTDSSGVRRFASLLSVSPTRINFRIPAETAIGPARATIRAGGSSEQSADIRIDPVAPALFSANADGRGVGAIIAVRVNGNGQSFEPVFTFDGATRGFVPKPLSLGNLDEQVYLLLFGTGIRGAGAPGRVTVSIAGRPVPVIGAAAQSEFAGLDQVNVGPLPRSLAGRGEQPVVLTVERKTANAVSVSFQ